jgi:hypothetical protein
MDARRSTIRRWKNIADYRFQYLPSTRSLSISDVFFSGGKSGVQSRTTNPMNVSLELFTAVCSSTGCETECRQFQGPEPLYFHLPSLFHLLSSNPNFVHRHTADTPPNFALIDLSHSFAVASLEHSCVATVLAKDLIKPDVETLVVKEQGSPDAIFLRTSWHLALLTIASLFLAPYPRLEQTWTLGAF